MSDKTKGSSCGKETRTKETQFQKIFEADLDSFLDNHDPTTPYTCIELYGGKYTYDPDDDDDDRTQVEGSALRFCRAATQRKVNFNYIAYEADEERAASLTAGLREYGKRVKIRNEFNYNCADYLKKVVRSDSRGLILSDPNGMEEMDMLMEVQEAFPNFSILINFNSTILKRRETLFVNGRTTVPPQYLIGHLNRLPRWPSRFLSKTKDIHQWLLVYLNKDKVDPASFDFMVPFDSKKAPEYLEKAAMHLKDVKSINAKPGVNMYLYFRHKLNIDVAGLLGQLNVTTHR